MVFSDSDSRPIKLIANYAILWTEMLIIGSIHLSWMEKMLSTFFGPVATLIITDNQWVQQQGLKKKNYTRSVIFYLRYKPSFSVSCNLRPSHWTHSWVSFLLLSSIFIVHWKPANISNSFCYPLSKVY